MTLKQIFAALLTAFVTLNLVILLLGSWQQPQIQSRLELYQTDLLLHATELKSDQEIAAASQTLVGDKPLETAQKQYESVREGTQETLSQLLPGRPVAELRLEELSTRTLKELLLLQLRLDLRLGVLKAVQGDRPGAVEIWTALGDRLEQQPVAGLDADLPRVLAGLWSEPPRLLPTADESLIQESMEGWFEYQALARLYELQQRQSDLAALQAAEQVTAQQAVYKLLLVSAIPGLGSFIGLTLLIGLLIQWGLKRKQAVLAGRGDLRWSTPWDWSDLLIVLMGGFFFLGQIVLSQILVPLTVQGLSLNPAMMTVRTQAVLTLITYGFLTAGSLGVLFWVIKPFRPLPPDWFRFSLRGNWVWWAVGGYCVALPLVIAVSLINQQIWQGQGGSNPILSLALQAEDPVALLIFFSTASIAAPLFEEILFRGFLLPSLTRYVPVWGAIALSSLIFALAHLSLSEVLPLATLGCVLGFVYTRSRNLLAPMLLHGLWNSGTLVSLVVLGSGLN